MATVGDIIDQALRLVNRVDASYRTRALEAVDRSVRIFSDRLPWYSLVRNETFVSDGTDKFVFPQRVRQLISVGDLTNKELVGVGAHFERQFPEWQLGTKPQAGPFKWRPDGTVPVIQDPAAATYITIETSGSDSQTVYVRGQAQDTTASGTPLEFYDITETITAQETPVTSAQLFYRIYAIEAANNARSFDIITRYATGNLPASRIAAAERYAKYQRIEWLSRPAAGATFQCRYYAEPAKIVAETQALDPQIDQDFLVWRTVGDLHWVAEQAGAAQAAWGRADSRIDELSKAERTHGDRLDQAIPYAPFIDYDDYDVIA